MQLKKLEIYGFKSFSDRTVIEFDKGITGIVGPNGSGKSNIVDSVMWVLGEQSVKNLRGSRMEDVVFKGSDKRKPNGFAEVSITLDNSDGTLPINFNEVSISRRLYRSGESRYCINGAECRLKDITSLFLDSGIGKYGYSIIGQGRVSEILNSTPEGRRYIFDEAAGIMKYKTRKEESEKHLFLTQENLSRANDLIYEIEGNLPSLKTAAEKAEKYISVAGRLKKCETTRFVLLHERYKASEERLQKQIDLIQNDIILNEKAKFAAEEKLRDVNERYATVFDHCEKLRANRMESIRTAERLKGEYRFVTERVSQINRDEAENKSNKKKYSDEAEALSELIENESKKNAELLLRIEKNTSELEKQTEYANKLKKEHDELVEKLAQARNRHIELVNEETKAKVRLAELTTRRQMLVRQRDDAESYSKEELEKLTETELICASAKANANEAQSALEKARDDFARASSEYEAINEEYTEATATFESIAKTAEAKKSRLATLNELKESMEAFNNSTKAVMRLKNSDKPFADDIIGTVSDIIRVDKEYETAIEVALGAAVQNIVTKTDTAAKEIIEYLRANRLGYATFLPLNSVQGRRVNDNDLRTLRQKGFCGIAGDLIKYDSTYKCVVENLLGRVVIAENMDCAINIARSSRYMFKIVTLQGDVINPYGSISGGSRGKSNVSNVFSRSRETDELEAALKETTVRLRKLADKINSLKQQRISKKQELDEKQSYLHNKDIEYNAAKNSCKYVLEEFERAKNAKEQRERQSLNAGEEINAIDAQIKELTEKTENLSGTVIQANTEMNTLAARESASKEALQQCEAKLTDMRLAQTELDGKLQIVTASAEELQARHTEKLRLAQEAENNIALLAEERENAIANMQELEENIKQTEKTEQEEIDVLKKCEEDLRSLEKTKKQREDEIRSAESMLLDINSKLHDYDMEKAKVIMESDNLQSRMWEVYEVSLGDAIEAEREEGDIEELNKKIRDIKSEITRMGPINPEAPEQYETQSARWQTLCAERDDLIAASKDIEKLIAEITKEMRVRFDEEFKIINEYFSDMFKRLFNGGTARLELCNSDDILEAGIDIIAQPPGKKLQNISLMSGGEKALIAIALLFALLKRRPAPFCILDEIDTALDEKNVYTLANLISSFNSTIQFIIISHRKGTMEASNALYGVSMEEKGVSSLVSVKLEAAV